MHASFVGTDRQTDRDGPDLSRVLTPATTVKLLDDLKAGRPVKIGPQNATGSIDIRIHSEGPIWVKPCSFIHRGERGEWPAVPRPLSRLRPRPLSLAK